MKAKSIYMLAAISFLVSPCFSYAANGCAAETINKKEKLGERFARIEAERRLQRDYLQAFQLRQLDPQRTVSVVIGGPHETAGPNDARLIRQLVLKIRKSGRTIIYDADASTAKLIATAAGEFGLGISGRQGHENSRPDNRVVVIENTSLRMDAFLFRYTDKYQDGHQLIVGLDSPSGVGLLLQNHPNATVLDSVGNWNNQLQTWVHSLGEKAAKLHLVTPPETGVLRNSNDISALELSPVTPQDARVYRARIETFEQTVATQSPELSREAAQFVTDIMNGEARGLTKMGGAVVFCSAVGDPSSNGALVQIATILGRNQFPVKTGGSLATMELVNRAAKEAGGPSIGFPIVRPEGHPEFNVPRDAHTETHLVEAHPARLHFLLEGSQVVFIGPGGKGIVKEIGATLIKIAAEFGSDKKIPKIVLIDDGYYGGLRAFIDTLPIPQSIKENVELLPLEGATDENVMAIVHAAQMGSGL